MKITGSVNYRPVRIGFLAPIDDLGTISRIAQLNACIWGGRYNPIIPYFEEGGQRWQRHHSVTTGLEVARGYINFFEPDVLVETAPGMAKKLGWPEGERHFGLPRVIPLNEFYKLDSRGFVDFPLGNDIIEVMQHLYVTDYRYERRFKESFANIEEKQGDAFFDVVCGRYPPDERLAYITEAYKDIFTPEAVPADATTALRHLKEGIAGPLWLTRHELEESLGRGGNEDTFYIFDPTNPQDVIDYWNFRLVARRTIPINVNWLSECADFVQETIKANHRPIPNNSFGTMFTTTVCLASSIDDERRNQILGDHLSGVPAGSFYTKSESLFWKERKRGVNRGETKIMAVGKAASFTETVEDNSIKIPSPAPTFVNQPGRYAKTHWMNVVSVTAFNDEDTVATVYPSNMWNPGYPRLSTGDMRVTREGWVVHVQYDIGYERLSVETGRNAIIKWLKIQGIDGTPSEEGQIAAQVIAAAGGLMACGMFADHETLKLLGGMAEGHSEVGRNGKRVAKAVPDRSKHVNTIRQHFKEREKRSFGFWNKLDYFLQRSVFRAGLRVQCPICSHQNWFDLEAISYEPNCTRCLNDFEFSQSPTHIDKVDWFYRIIGPFAAPDYARGGYAVALTLRALSQHHDTEMTWSTGLTLKQLNCEVDFVAWRRPRRFGRDELDEPQLIVGEAKSFGRNSINDDAITTLKRVAEAFPGSIMVVSILRNIEELTLAEIGRLRQLALWGRRSKFEGQPINALILLTQTELFADHGIRGAWEKIDGKQVHSVYDFDDLSTLGDLTVRRYLGLAEYWDKQASTHAHQSMSSILQLLKIRALDRGLATN